MPPSADHHSSNTMIFACSPCWTASDPFESNQRMINQAGDKLISTTGLEAVREHAGVMPS